VEGAQESFTGQRNWSSSERSIN